MLLLSPLRQLVDSYEAAEQWALSNQKLSLG